MIDDFHKEYIFLSNFYPSPVHYEGILYPTVEHAFQAAKMASEVDRLAIQNAESAGEAKYIGRRGLMRADWEDIKIDVMRRCLQRKFLLNPELLKKLRGTAPQMLIEGNNWHDNFWGYCTCPKCEAGNAPGRNQLGKLLMEIRDNHILGKYAFCARNDESDENIGIFYSAEECKMFLKSHDLACDDKHLLIISKPTSR